MFPATPGGLSLLPAPGSARAAQLLRFICVNCGIARFWTAPTMNQPIQSSPRAIAAFFERRVPILVVLSIGSIAVLLSGGSFLEASLVGGLPVGNVVATAALCFPACVAIGLTRSRTTVRYFSVAGFIAAFAWLPVSIGLAGNLTLNFSGLRGQIWVWSSLTTIGIILISLAWATVDHLIRRRVHRGSADAARQ